MIAGEFLYLVFVYDGSSGFACNLHVADYLYLYTVVAEINVVSTFCLFAQQIVGELREDAAPSIFENDADAFVSLRFAGNLREDLELLSCSVKAQALLAKSEAEKKGERGAEGEEMARYLSEDAKQRVEFDARGRYRVTPIPVAMKTTTCKPLFFDMVDERVTYPNLEARSRVAEKKGWFSGWW